MAKAAQAFAAALALHRQGALDQAAAAYDAILQAAPDHVPSLCCLCLCRVQRGHLAEAAGLGRRAAILAPFASEAWHGLGNAQAALGRHDAAASGFRRTLLLRPDFAEGHNNLGNSLLALGRFEAAWQSFAAALRLRPDYAEADYNIGNVLVLLRRPAEALAHFRRALASRPSFAQALNNLGVVHQTIGHPPDSILPARRALFLQPDYGEAWFNLGNALRQSGRHAEALQSYRRAVILAPHDANASANLGMELTELDQVTAAVTALGWAVRLDPLSAPIHYNLGHAWESADRVTAIRSFRHAVCCDPATLDAFFGIANQEGPSIAVHEFARCLALKPDFAEARNNLGIALQALDRMDEAAPHYRRAIILQPDYSHPYNNLGSALQAEDRPDRAVVVYDKAVRLAPQDEVAHNNRGIALLESGHLDEAVLAFESALALAPTRGLFYRTLAETGRITPDSDHGRRMQSLANNPAAGGEEDQMHLHFALGRVFADAGAVEDAFTHFSAGNRLKRSTLLYDETATLGLFARIEQVFTPSLLARAGSGGAESSLPVFVLGMPRSGTTLVEQVLASHPAIQGAGEILDLRRLVEAEADFPDRIAAQSPGHWRRLGAAYVSGLRARFPAAQRVIDKMPANFQLIGLIRLALPQARIIHVQRDPIDSCLSSFSKLFAGLQPFTYELGELGRYYRAYERLMAHWRSILPPGVMLEVRYEELVADMETEARRLVDFCGLPWDAACLSFHLTERPVRTASAFQVRQPLYGRAVGGWQAYAELAAPLLAALRA